MTSVTHMPFLRGSGVAHPPFSRTPVRSTLAGPFVRLLLIPAIACLLWPAQAAQAAISAVDLQVVARTLGFLDPPLTGDVNVGIVFDFGNDRSAREAVTIVRLMGDGMRVGKLVLRPVMVPLEDAGSANVRFFLLSESLGERADALRAAAHLRHLPCLTSDLDQVRAGNCAVGIQSSPKVEILVNRAEASASYVGFASVFRMMITEL